LTKRK